MSSIRSGSETSFKSRHVAFSRRSEFQPKMARARQSSHQPRTQERVNRQPTTQVALVDLPSQSKDPSICHCPRWNPKPSSKPQVPASEPVFHRKPSPNSPSRHVAPRPAVLRGDSTALDLRALQNVFDHVCERNRLRETTEMRLPRASMF